MQTAKLFVNGRSQAVRLPKEYQFQGDDVFIQKHGRNNFVQHTLYEVIRVGYYETNAKPCRIQTGWRVVGKYGRGFSPGLDIFYTISND